MCENTGDRPIQIGSHYHFFEINRACDSIGTARGYAVGRPSGYGSEVRTGQGRTVRFVRRAELVKCSAFRARSWEINNGLTMSVRLMPKCTVRRTGDRVRLADTELIVEVEKDFAV